MRASSSTKQQAISVRAASSIASGSTTPTISKGSSCSNFFSATLLHLHVAAGEVLDHRLALVAGAEAGVGGLPAALAAEAAVLRLRDAHQRLFGAGVRRMRVLLVALADDLAYYVLAHQRVRHHRRLQPAAGDALLRAVAEAGLIAGVLREGASVLAGLVGAHGLGRSHEGGVLHHRDATRVGGVVLDAKHEAGDVVEGVVLLPALVRPVLRVGVHVNVVAVLDAQLAGVLRVDVHLVLPYAGRPLVAPVGVAEVARPDPVPVRDRPGRVVGVARLGGEAVVAVPLLPQRVHAVPGLRPGHLDVAHRSFVRVDRGGGDAVVVGPDRVVFGDDDVRQVRRRLHRLPVDDHVLAVLYELVLVAVEFDAAGLVVERLGLVDLLPAGDARVGPEQHQGSAVLF